MTPSPSLPDARIGSMDVFWTLIEPILNTLSAERICEIGLAEGALTARLLAWGQTHGCAYVGIDPELNPTTAKLASGAERASGCELHKGFSLAILPTLDRCSAYFLDGDHNFFTVRNELTSIACAPRRAAYEQPSPIIFVHDVGWPWGRRDMYYLPSVVPVAARQSWSETLGVSLEGDDLIDGGLREPGRYAIAVSAGGPQNGVLTAVEDFLAGPEGADWSVIVLPVAYGLAILYKPADIFLPAACRAELQALERAAATTERFFQACERNYLQLYLHDKYVQHLAETAARDLQSEGTAHHATLAAYADLERAYGELLAQNHALQDEYSKLLQAYHLLQDAWQKSSVTIDTANASCGALRS